MKTPRSPIALESATLLLDRAAHTQFNAFMEELRAECEAAVGVLLCATPEEVLVAQGSARAIDGLIQRMEKAEQTLVKYQNRS